MACSTIAMRECGRCDAGGSGVSEDVFEGVEAVFGVEVDSDVFEGGVSVPV